MQVLDFKKENTHHFKKYVVKIKKIPELAMLVARSKGLEFPFK